MKAFCRPAVFLKTIDSQNRSLISDQVQLSDFVLAFHHDEDRRRFSRSIRHSKMLDCRMLNLHMYVTSRSNIPSVSAKTSELLPKSKIGIDRDRRFGRFLGDPGFESRISTLLYQLMDISTHFIGNHMLKLLLKLEIGRVDTQNHGKTERQTHRQPTAKRSSGTTKQYLSIWGHFFGKKCES